MFEDVWLSNESKDESIKRWGIIFLSFAIHSIIIFFVLFGPLITTDTEFPDLKITDVYVSIVPKPPSSMRAARKKTQKKTKLVKKDIKIEKKDLVTSSVLIVPIEIPGEIIDEDEEYLVSDIEFGSGGGVEGGIEGGYEGGIIGGSLLGDAVEEEIDPIRVNIGDIKLINYVKPIYPSEALTKRIKGTVIVEIITGTFGRVKKWRIIHREHPLLGQAAIDAIKQWVYKPYLVRGKPTPIIITVTVTFDKANY